MTPHRWEECRPALMSLDGAAPEHAAEVATALERVWAALPAWKRIYFHEFTCFHIVDEEHLAVVQGISDVIRSIVDGDGRPD